MITYNVTDWSNITTFNPNLYFKPQTKDELIAFLNRMNGSGKSFRVLGSLHSCAPIASSDAIIDVSGLPKSMEFSLDNSQVKLSANWQLRDFLAEAGKRDKSLPATGGTDEQTIAGLISTNTAPASSQVSMYEGLLSVTYITLDNKTNTFIEKTVSRGSDEFANVVCSLGAIGIITDVEFALIKQPYFNTIQKVIPISEVLNDVAATTQKYLYWRIDWLCNTDKGVLWAAVPVDASESDPNGDYNTDEGTGLIDVIATYMNKFNPKLGPTLTPEMKLMYDLIQLTYGTVKATGPLRNMLPVDREVKLKVAMAEWSFAPKSLPRVLELYKEYFMNNGWPNMPIEIELTKTDSFNMSPWNWEGESYIVKINLMYMTCVFDNQDEIDAMHKHINGLWNKLKEAGIPFKAHWGKINFMDQEFVSNNFKLKEFLPAVQPCFMNNYLAGRLLPSQYNAILSPSLRTTIPKRTFSTTTNPVISSNQNRFAWASKPQGGMEPFQFSNNNLSRGMASTPIPRSNFQPGLFKSNGQGFLGATRLATMATQAMRLLKK